MSSFYSFFATLFVAIFEFLHTVRIYCKDHQILLRPSSSQRVQDIADSQPSASLLFLFRFTFGTPLLSHLLGATVLESLDRYSQSPPPVYRDRIKLICFHLLFDQSHLKCLPRRLFLQILMILNPTIQIF